MAVNNQGRRPGSRLSFSSPRVKVSLPDNRLCRRASQHSTLTSYQQLRKVSHTEVRRDSRYSKHSSREKWDERHPRPGHRLPTCQKKRLRR